MITVKSPEEFGKMAAAGAVVAEVLERLRHAALPGVTTADLDELAASIFRDRGCTPSFLGYHGFPATVCTSPNDAIVHGIPGPYQIKDGDVLSIDAGAIYEGWHGDAAVTFAIGDVPGRVRELISVTEEALRAGIEQAGPDSRIGDIGAAVEGVAKAQGLAVVREYIGHGIGRAMHEEPQVPNFGRRGTGPKLKSGMAICIEPMFNLGGAETSLGADGWTVSTADGSLSAHFEHTVAITADGPRVLTEKADGGLAA